MGKNKIISKGEHEACMEKAKEMIDRGCGMGQIMEETNLTAEDIVKAKKKWVDRS